jgi:hypothetical protein
MIMTPAAVIAGIIIEQRPDLAIAFNAKEITEQTEVFLHRLEVIGGLEAVREAARERSETWDTFNIQK